MPTITTTTDSAEQVKEALDIKPGVPQTAEADAATKTPADKAPAPPRDETQERIDRLTWERYQAQSRADEAQRRIADLEARLAAQPAVAQPSATEEPIVIKPYDKPKPKIDEFETIEDYADAIGDWNRAAALHEADQRLDAKIKKVQESSRAMTDADRAAQSERAAMDAHLTRLNAYRAAHPEYDETVRRALAAGLPTSPAMNAHFVNSEMGPVLMHYLADHPDECIEIASLPFGRAVARLGRLEAKLDTAAPVASTPRPRKVEQPAAPPENIGGGTKGSSKDPGKMTFKEYKEWRRTGGGQ